MPPESFVDAATVARFLAITRRQVLEMTRKGIIPAHPLGTGTNRRVWRYKLSEVNATVVSDAREPAPTPRNDRALAKESTPHKMTLGSPRSQRRNSNG
jgi:hypothetical protein